MSFISYAQNFEDVMLWRALKHINSGFYIDVGANSPEIDSVTKAFYDHGWHGINIEPLPTHHADLMKERPRDINLQCAAGSTKSEIELWECDVRGWATCNTNIVAQHRASGHEGAFHKVPVDLLSNICAEHANGEIHFLKIDVEGAEKSVIDGMDFSRFRPWILVVEATLPNSTKEVHDEWEETVLAANYVLAYADG
ncbi:MAG: FkbM family methyltransferase, partial [Candidatus Thiodiazotropha sp.]